MLIHAGAGGIAGRVDEHSLGRRGRELARELGKVVGRQILVGHVVVAILGFLRFFAFAFNACAVAALCYLTAVLCFDWDALEPRLMFSQSSFNHFVAQSRDAIQSENCLIFHLRSDFASHVKPQSGAS